MTRKLSMHMMLALAILAACGREGALGPPFAAATLARQVAPFATGAWSDPVKLGPAINVPRVTDGNATLSADGLALYFDSDRADLPGAQGARDIWVSRRACSDWLNPECEWQTPVNVGANINSPYVDGLPAFSADGHLMFFLSHGTRANCAAEPEERDPTRPCDADIFVSWRADVADDLGWGPAVPLPEPVNTSGEDNVAAFVAVGEPGRGNLYFDRPNGPGVSDVYYVPIAVTSRGAATGPVVNVLGPITPLDEINLPNSFDIIVTVRGDGRELFFTSNRPGGKGALDIWTSTRRSPHDPWSPPTNVAEVNSIRADLAPRLSRNGEVLLFTSNREMSNPQCVAAGLVGSCGWDIYVSTRSPQP